MFGPERYSHDIPKGLSAGACDSSSPHELVQVRLLSCKDTSYLVYMAPLTSEIYVATACYYPHFPARFPYREQYTEHSCHYDPDLANTFKLNAIVTKDTELTIVHAIQKS